VKQAALSAGAYGCSISGSGPSMFAVTNSERSALKIAAAMRKTFLNAAGVKSEAYISRINKSGAKIFR
jgi:homoserine kinase